MLDFEILFWHKYKTNEQNIKAIFSQLTFCRSAISFDNLKYLARHTINKFLKLNRRYFFQCVFAQSVGAVEYTDCFSAEG